MRAKIVILLAIFLVARIVIIHTNSGTVPPTQIEDVAQIAQKQQINPTSPVLTTQEVPPTRILPMKEEDQPSSKQSIDENELPAVYPDRCDEKHGPKHLSPAPPLPPGMKGLEPPINIYIKTSSAAKYLVRCKWILRSWGRDVHSPHSLTFLTDDRNLTGVSEMEALFPEGSNNMRAAVLEDTQAFYNVERKKNYKRSLGYAAQRRKMRWVLNQSVPDDNGWVCYVDDDLVVNMTNLVRDLFAKQPLCSPNCFITQIARFKPATYTIWPTGAWCMESAFVRRMQREYLPISDDIWSNGTIWNWNWGPDDLSIGYLVHTKIGSTDMLASDRWRIEQRPAAQKPHWFDATRRSMYAVYHQVDALTGCPVNGDENESSQHQPACVFRDIPGPRPNYANSKPSIQAICPRKNDKEIKYFKARLSSPTP